jgi:hypothetical protein
VTTYDPSVRAQGFERISGRPSPSLPVRVVHALKALRHVRAVRRENAGLAELGPDLAWREFGAYADVGNKLEALLGRYPRVADWVAFTSPAEGPEGGTRGAA